MTLPCIEDMKERHFYSPEDPPFDMKHQLMSADSLPVVKIDLSRKVNFHYFFFHFYTIWEFFPKPFFLLVWAWTSNFSSFMMHESHFLGFWESLFLNISNFDETIKNWQNWQIGICFSIFGQKSRCGVLAWVKYKYFCSFTSLRSSLITLHSTKSYL